MHGADFAVEEFERESELGGSGEQSGALSWTALLDVTSDSTNQCLGAESPNPHSVPFCPLLPWEPSSLPPPPTATPLSPDLYLLPFPCTLPQSTSIFILSLVLSWGGPEGPGDRPYGALPYALQQALGWAFSY